MKRIALFFTALVIGIIATAQVPNDGLFGYWPFNGNALDASGNGNNGYVYNTTLTTDRFGNLNTAYDFNGVNSYIDFNEAMLPINGSDFSISMWVLSENIVNDSIHAIIAQYEPNPAGRFHIFEYNGKFKLFSGDTDYPSSSTSFEIMDVPYSVWTHITVVSSQNFVDVYINGVLKVGSLPISNILNANTMIGWDGYQNRFYNGKIDDVRIYNRALDDEEVQALYNENLCFETITVTDTLIINANLISMNPVTYLNTIKIYPNPTFDHINIDSDEQSVGFNIKIINTLSQIVYQTTISEPSYTVDLNNWTGKGTYFVQLFNLDGNLIDIKKIILQ